MDANVQKLTANAGKLSIDSETPKYSTNWCDLSEKLRSECIQRMDFETRMSLRRTSKTEKSLVESAKCHLEHLTLDFDEYTTSLTASDENSIDIYRRDCMGTKYQDMFRSALNILEHCEIDNVFLRTQPRTEYLLVEIIAGLKKHSPFRFKTFDSNTTNFKLTTFFLENCEGVENVRLFSNRMGGKAVKVIDFPSVINAKLFQFMYLPADLPNVDRSLFQLVQKWIDNDAEVGKVLRFASNGEREDDAIDLFESIFDDRVISEDYDTVRIRTDNPSKHVVLKRDKTWYEHTYFSCTIISSNLLEPIEKSKWADPIHPIPEGEDVYGEDVVDDMDLLEENLQKMMEEFLANRN